MDVIRFLRVMNSVVSLSSFVNMSAMLIFPSMWLIETVLLETDSLMAFSRIVICLRPFVVVDFDQHTHALLSLNTCMGSLSGIYMCFVPMSHIICCRRRSSLTHSSVAYISASAELRAVTFCLFETQWIGPFWMMINPDIERVIKDSSSCGLLASGID